MLNERDGKVQELEVRGLDWGSLDSPCVEVGPLHENMNASGYSQFPMQIRFQMIAQQYKGELIKYQDRLREREEQLRRMNDYELLKSENARIKDESRQTREVLAKEKLQLQQRNFGKSLLRIFMPMGDLKYLSELEAQCRDLAARMEEWKPSEENPFRKELIRLKMEFEKARSEWKTNETHYRKQLEEEVRG